MIRQFVFFTLNGKLLGPASPVLDVDVDSLWPAVGLGSNCAVICNFGQHPFSFCVSAHHAQPHPHAPAPIPTEEAKSLLAQTYAFLLGSGDSAAVPNWDVVGWRLLTDVDKVSPEDEMEDDDFDDLEEVDAELVLENESDVGSASGSGSVTGSDDGAGM
eukprot:TRINITY_DN1743_c0_g1_i3.p3 TRINITY_DN1743_c0_g1~~TRINITY_DN1743_c0_g1_i3.p3  ORF type:complete len:159 (-),score=42.93 TRINITY_DN1743_c0_g1_i3:81-557(-)